MALNQQDLQVDIATPVQHQVFQRDGTNHADVLVELSLNRPLDGRVEVRFTASEEPSEWISLGRLSGTQFSGQHRGLGVGQYRAEIRVLDAVGRSVVHCVIDPIFIGDLWILAGQSNMEGCGKLTDCDSPQIGISCFDMTDSWGLANEPLCWSNESIDPVHWWVSEDTRSAAIEDARNARTQGAGLGIAFGKEIMRYTGVPVGLIMCARGGTSMTDWDPELRDLGNHSLYGAMLRKIGKLGGRVRGCLWYQGESDANPGDAARYRPRTRHWIDSLRRDTKNADLPFIYAQLSLFYDSSPDSDSSGWDAVRHAQYGLESEVDAVAMVPTLDANMADCVHLDAPSIRKVGQRMAWRALALSYGRTLCLPGPRPNQFAWNPQRTCLVLHWSGINGRLIAVPKVFGFSLDSRLGSVLPDAQVSLDGSQVELQFAQPVSADSVLWYGRGFNPTVNLTDERGIPVPAFGPISV